VTAVLPPRSNLSKSLTFGYSVTIAGSSNGRTSGFGPEYLGSSPSPAAKMYTIIDQTLSSCYVFLGSWFLERGILDGDATDLCIGRGATQKT
jgi:hypothetical protein